MTTYIDSHIISLTSDTATTVNNSLLSDTNYEFRGLLRDDPDIIQRQISILSAQIPVSFYNVNEYNNIFSGIINLIGSFTCIIPRGNYNANSLCIYLNNYIQINIGYTTVSFAIDKITGRLDWRISNPTNDPNILLTFRKESTCQELFGFKAGLDYFSTQIINNYAQLLSSYPMNLLGPKVLSIKSPSLNTANVSSYYKSTNTLLATIPIDAPLFGQLDYHNYSNLRTTFLNTDLNNIEIQIYDEKNNLIDFNGVNWSITLAIHLTKVGNQMVPSTPPFRHSASADNGAPALFETPTGSKSAFEAIPERVIGRDNTKNAEISEASKLSENDQILFS